MEKKEDEKNEEKKKSFDEHFYSNNKFESDDPNTEIVPDTIYRLKDFARESKQSGRHVTRYHWKKEYGGSGKFIPIISTETVSHVVKGIITQNLSDGYSMITSIGKSGSGKTTLVSTVVHRLHTMLEDMGYEYAISWYRRQAIGRIDDIIDSLPKGVNRIMVFDDATFGDRDLTEEEAKTLIARLTYVRHDLKAKVMVIVIMHYSRGLGPFLRDGNITFWTSITHIERENMVKLYPRARAIIDKFFKKYGGMLKNGFYTSEIDHSNILKYQTKNPFKIAFCQDFESFRFIHYPRESCAFCTPKFNDNVDDKKSIDLTSERELVQKLQASYKHPSYIKQAYRWFFWSRGAESLEPKHKAIIKHISDYYSKHPHELDHLVKELEQKSIDNVLIARGLNIKRTDAENALRRRVQSAKKQREYDKKSGKGNGSRYDKKEEAPVVIDTEKNISEDDGGYEREKVEEGENGFDTTSGNKGDEINQEEDGFDSEPTKEGLESAGVSMMDSGLGDGEEDLES